MWNHLLNVCLLALSSLAIIGLSAIPIHATAVQVTMTGKPVAVASPNSINGYTMLDENGNIYNFGTDYFGGAGEDKVAPFVSMAYTPSGKGYALMDSQGH